MFSFFSLNNKNNSTSNAYNNSSQVFGKSFTTSTWLGRTVYFLTGVIARIPCFSIIQQLVDHIFMSSQAKSSSAPAPSPSPSPQPNVVQPQSQTPTPSKDEVFDAEEDEKATKKKKEGFAEIKPVVDDDEAIARMLQAELNMDYQNHENLHPHTLDEGFAHALQQEEYRFAFKKKDDHSPHSQLREDEKLAMQILQEELDAAALQNQPPLPYYVGTPQDKDKKETKIPEAERKPIIPQELEKMQQAEQAAYQILSTYGLVACEVPENEFTPNSKTITIYEPSKGILRGMAGTLTKEYPQALSPAVLRRQRDEDEVDFDQYIILRLKQFSHVEQVKGLVTLPSGKNFKLEGFWEVFAAPMVISSYETFSKTSKFFKSEDREWILNELNKLIFCDYVSKKDVEDLALTLRTPGFVGPVTLQAGFIDHCAALIWVNNFLLYIDRSCIHTDPGVYVLYLPERELLTEDFIKECVERENLNDKNYQILERLVSQLGAVLVHYEKMHGQVVGNCTHATMEAVLYSLMATKTLFNAKGTKWDGPAWDTAFTKVSPEQEKWSAHERRLIFDEMMKEIEEWLTHQNDFGKKDMKKVYQDLLNFWVATPKVKRDPRDLDKVLKLLEALQKDTTS